MHERSYFAFASGDINGDDIKNRIFNKLKENVCNVAACRTYNVQYTIHVLFAPHAHFFTERKKFLEQSFAHTKKNETKQAKDDYYLTTESVLFLSVS